MIADTSVRVRPGHDGTLVDLSPLGALIELRQPMAPGTHVDVQLCQADRSVVLRSLVLRCSVRAIAALDGVTYRAALLFDTRRGEDFWRAASAQDGYRVPAEHRVATGVHGSALPEHSGARVASSEGSAK
jgi:hypothetical protein